jgi:8-oxo-dGTP diphosphatase
VNNEEAPIRYAADAVVFANIPETGQLSVLLIRRSMKSDAFPGAWALPGGYVGEETSRWGAVRELEEETGLAILPEEFEQLPIHDAVARDPRERVVSVPYATRLKATIPVKGADDAIEAQWVEVAFALYQLPLAFDHAEIIKDGLRNFGLGGLILAAAERSREG